jgi:hypothetical protein
MSSILHSEARGSMLRSKRADAKLELRTGPEPSAEWSGGWPMDIIEEHASSIPEQGVSPC